MNGRRQFVYAGNIVRKLLDERENTIVLRFRKYCFILLHTASYCFILLHTASYCFILLQADYVEHPTASIYVRKATPCRRTDPDNQYPALSHQPSSPCPQDLEHGFRPLLQPLLHGCVLRDVVGDQLQSLAVCDAGLHAGLVVEGVFQQMPV